VSDWTAPDVINALVATLALAVGVWTALESRKLQKRQLDLEEEAARRERSRLAADEQAGKKAVLHTGLTRPGGLTDTSASDWSTGASARRVQSTYSLTTYLHTSQITCSISGRTTALSLRMPRLMRSYSRMQQAPITGSCVLNGQMIQENGGSLQQG